MDLKVSSDKLVADEEYLASLPSEYSSTLQKELQLINQMAEDLTDKGDPKPIYPAKVAENLRKMIASADESFKKANYPEALKKLGLALAISQKRPLWEKAAVQIEDSLTVVSRRCDVYLAAKDWQNALNDASLLVALKPAAGKNHLRQGEAYEGLGQKELARQSYISGLAMEPSDTKLLGALALIDGSKK